MPTRAALSNSSLGSQPRLCTTAEQYHAALARRTPDERRRLAHLKRLLERYRGDPRFRAVLDRGDADPCGLADNFGTAVNPRTAKPLLRAIACGSLAANADAEPLIRLWRDFSSDLERLQTALVAAGDCPDANPRFHAWRHRQISRVKDELGGLANNIPHSVLAFELSTGCSIGCWFCGVSAERLRGNFAYTRENAARWRACLEQALELFGDAVQTGFCYWASDPSDNPDYPQFIEDYYRVTGALPQTTTAAPLRDLALTRRVMALHDRFGSMPDRFSILTLKTLNAVHAAFTAEELLEVELVLQNTGALTAKSPTGRACDRPDLLAREKAAGAAALDGATIACVSGFLVNMVEGRVRLIAPTRTSERSPLGYRVFGERRFGSAGEFRHALSDLIDEHMAMTVGAGPLRFREDLVYRQENGGFVVEARGSRFAVSGFPAAGRLGDLLRDGCRTADEIAASLAPEGVDLFVAADLLQRLFDRGLLESAEANGIRSRHGSEPLSEAARPSS